MKHLFSPILFAALTACTIVRPIPHDPLPVSPPPPTETEQHLQQLNALHAEVSSLKKQLNSLQTRVQQLERSATPNTPARSRTTPPTKKNTSKKTPKKQITATSSSTSQIASPATPLTNPTLNTAREQYRTGNYTAVLKTLRHTENGGSGSEIDRQSMFLLLRSHYKLNNCESTINIGQRYITLFRSTPEAAETMLIIGQCQWQMQQKDIARNTWRKLIHIYPDSAAAKRAALQLK